MTTAIGKVIVHETKGQWAWTAVTTTNDAIATASEPYATWDDAEKMARALFPDAHIVVQVKKTGGHE